MLTTTIPPIPDRLYARIYWLIYVSADHRDRPEQGEAKAALHAALVNHDPQAVYGLPEALRQHGRAFARDCNGHFIIGENWVRDRALLLAAEVEVHIESEVRLRRAQRGQVAA